MGIDYHVCMYCQEVDSEYRIRYCDKCNRRVCQACDDDVPKFTYDDENLNTCGYCQIKDRLSDKMKKDFEKIEGDLISSIKKLNEKLYCHYKTLIKQNSYSIIS